ncbi:MAG: BatD family protein [Bacteroidota bacterium]|nr:BatD family protein [Candidatus Kapabacteria bacterium]MDW8219563.1 BatD family protein [Bacteroidota bacterium]
MIRLLVPTLCIATSLVSMLMTAFAVYSQELTASVSSNPVSVGEHFQISFTSSAPMSNFKAPSFEGLSVLSGPIQSQSVRIVNGVMSQSVSYTYVVQAWSEGRVTISPASAEISGKRVQSNSLTIQVLGKQSNQRSTHGKSDALSAEGDLSKELQKGVFLKASVNKTSVVRGEQIIATYKLYTRITLTNYTPRKMPALTGFWSQDIESPQQLMFHDELINGQLFRVAAVKKTVLFPQQTGILELDPMEAEVVARVNVGRENTTQFRDPFDAFFHGGDPFADAFGQVQDVRLPLRSPTIKIAVRPLPETHIPAEFNGAVGTFSLETDLSTRSTRTNEPVKFTVRISGTGNLKLIDPIKLQLPPDIETYEPSVKENIDVSDNGASGSKIFEYLLIPRFAGEYKIAPLTFAYYDLEKKRYISLQSEEYTLNVEKGKDESTIIGGKYVSKDVVGINNDIRFIKLGNGKRLPRRGEGFYGSPAFFVALILPFMLFFGFIVYRRRDEQLRSNINLMKTRFATRVATQRLKEAKTYLQAHQADKFYEAISKALWGYMSDKLLIPPSSLSRESIRTALQERMIDGTLYDTFNQTLDACEFARFAPAQSVGEMQKLYNDAAHVIAALEEAFKKQRIH